MKALLKNYHQSPRKVRLVADVIRGKSVLVAREALRFLDKKSSPAIVKLLESAVANARSTGAHAEDLFVKTITVNKGMVTRHFRPMARGRAARSAKTMSIVAIELGTGAAPKVAKSAQGRSASGGKAAKKVAKAE